MNPIDFEGYALGDPKRIPNQAFEPTPAPATSRMRDVSHGVDTRLPPPMPRPAPMDAQELRDLSIILFRVQGEISRQSDQWGPLWAVQARYMTESFHGLVLALLTVCDPGHSERVPVTDARSTNGGGARDV